MEERNITLYRLEQSNKKVYILTTSLIADKLKILCQDSTSQIFIGLFNLLDLLNISQYFNVIKSVEQVQKYLNGIIERQRVEIFQNETSVNMILHLINNDNIIIPLTKKVVNIQKKPNIEYAQVSPIFKNSNKIKNANNNTVPNSPMINNTQISEWEIYQRSKSPKQNLTNQNYLNNNFNYQSPSIDNNIETNLNINKEEMIANNTYNMNKLIASPASMSSSFSQTDSFHSLNIEKIRPQKGINKIKPHQDKISQELKKVSKQVENCMKEIILYKKENIQLTNESLLLNKENDKLKKQIESFKKIIKEYETQTNALKNEFTNIQKDIISYEKKNRELLKLNEEYENENEQLKNEIEIYEKEKLELKSGKNSKAPENKKNVNKNKEIIKLNEDLKNKLELSTKENSELKSLIEKLKKNVQNSENKKDEIKNTKLEKLNEDLKNKLNSFVKENSQLKSEIEKLKEVSQNTGIKKEENKDKNLLKLNEELKNKFDLITKENSELKSQNETLKKSLENFENNAQEMKNINQELNKYKIYLKENEELKNQVINLENQIQELMQEKQEDEEEEEEEEEDDDEIKEETKNKIINKDKNKKEVEGDIIHNLGELELITKKINKKNKKLIIKLLYKASFDSDKASVFHQKCDSAKNTIVLVETKDGKRFGGYTSCSRKGDCVEKGDKKAFIFSFDKMKTYDNIPGEDAIGCYPKFGPVFLGCQIKIFDDCFTKGGSTYEKELNFETEEDYELTGGQRNFEVKDIEVYEVVFEKM